MRKTLLALLAASLCVSPAAAEQQFDPGGKARVSNYGTNSTSGDVKLKAESDGTLDVKPSALAAGSAIVGKVGIDQTTPLTTNGVNLLASPRATYSAITSAYAAYATPTDLACIAGSGTKTIAVLAFGIAIQSTAAALQTIDFVKRSTADTGGSPTALTAVPADSGDAATTASVNIYGAAPTTGTVVGTVDTLLVSSSTLTGTPTFIAVGSYYGNNFSVVNAASLQKPVILRGTGEGLCINYKGAALTGGFSSQVKALWVEY